MLGWEFGPVVVDDRAEVVGKVIQHTCSCSKFVKSHLIREVTSNQEVVQLYSFAPSSNSFLSVSDPFWSDKGHQPSRVSWLPEPQRNKRINWCAFSGQGTSKNLVVCLVTLFLAARDTDMRMWSRKWDGSCAIQKQIHYLPFPTLFKVISPQSRIAWMGLDHSFQNHRMKLSSLLKEKNGNLPEKVFTKMLFDFGHWLLKYFSMRVQIYKSSANLAHFSGIFSNISFNFDASIIKISMLKVHNSLLVLDPHS